MKTIEKFYRKIAEYLAKRVKPQTIQFTISVSFTIVSVCSMGILGVTLYNRFVNRMEDMTIESSEQLLNQTAINLETYLRNMRRISDAMYYSVIKDKDLAVDSVDEESWSCENGILSWRSARQEQYHNYIIEEVYPILMQKNTSNMLPIVTGPSLGANQAAITFLRRPELFSGLLALSGVYNSDYFFHGWCDENLYKNSPERFLENMPADHPYIDLYNQKKMIFCVGQGAWEYDGAQTLRNLKRIFDEKKINAW